MDGRIWQYVLARLAKKTRFRLDQMAAAGKSPGGRVTARMVAAGKLDPAALFFSAAARTPAGGTASAAATPAGSKGRWRSI